MPYPVYLHFDLYNNKKKIRQYIIIVHATLPKLYVAIIKKWRYKFQKRNGQRRWVEKKKKKNRIKINSRRFYMFSNWSRSFVLIIITKYLLHLMQCLFEQLINWKEFYFSFFFFFFKLTYNKYTTKSSRTCWFWQQQQQQSFGQNNKFDSIS